VLSVSSLSFISGIVGLNSMDIVLNTIAFGRSSKTKERRKKQKLREKIVRTSRM